MNRPLISLITVCYNAEALIESTLKSAISQTYKHFELVIIDGGSKDNTVEVVKKFQPYIGTLISEPDKGIYDAMNKGIKAAKGEWLYFLNAGDSFYDNQVLADVFGQELPSEVEFIYAKMQTVNEPTGINYIAGNQVTFKDFYFKYPICHQTTFTRKTAFEKFGFYDIKLKLLADIKWQMGLFKHNTPNALFVDRIIAFYDIQGASYHKRMQGYRELLSFSYQYFPIHIYLLSLLLYPIIWLKVKIIRAFQEQAWFKAYRQLKFRHRKANV